MEKKRIKIDAAESEISPFFSIQHILLPCQVLVPSFPQCNSTGDSSNWDIRCVLLAGLMCLVDLVESPFNCLVCYSNSKIIAGFSITGRSVKTRRCTRLGCVLTAKWLNRFIIFISCCRVQATGVWHIFSTTFALTLDMTFHTISRHFLRFGCNNYYSWLT